jgi:hypothetical protein
MPRQKLTPEMITAAIEGLESQRRRIDDQIAELRAMLSGSADSASARKLAKQNPRKMSAARRRQYEYDHQYGLTVSKAGQAKTSTRRTAKSARKKPL